MFGTGLGVLLCGVGFPVGVTLAGEGGKSHNGDGGSLVPEVIIGV